MDFKNILASLTTISEGETKETEKGRVHKGSYGTEYETDKEGNEKKKSKPETKKGRGRPKKDSDESGEVKKYDTKSLGDVFGGGKKPKKDVGTVSKKHSLKEYIESVEIEKEQLSEMMTQQPIPVVSKQGDSQSTGAGFLNIDDNSPAGQAMKDAIGKLAQQKKAQIVVPTQGQQSGTSQSSGAQQKPTGAVSSMVAQEASTGDYSAKKARAGKDIGKPGKQFGKIAKDAAKRYGSKERGEKVAGAVLAKLRSKANEEALDQPATMEQANGMGAIRLQGQKVDEKAPPGAKAERMVKHIKKSYAKDGKLTPKEKSIAYATAWKAHNKGKVEESIMLEDGTILTEGAMKDLVIRFIDDLEQGPKGYNIGAAVELGDKGLAQRIIDKTLHHGERYKRLAGTLKGQLRDAALEEFGFTNYEESLEEADVTPGDSDSIRRHTQHALAEPTSSFQSLDDPRMAVPRGTPTKFNRVVQKPTPWATDPIAAATDRAGNFLSSLGKGTKFTKEGTDMKDIQLEGWENQLNSLLTEGITVSSSQGQQGSPDSVSITATDNDAQSLMSVLRNAGIGGFGAEQSAPEVGYGVSSQGEEDFDGTGTEPQPAPDVVGDGDDMLSLIKKMAGLGGGDAEVVAVGGDEEGQDYEDEEGGEEDEGGQDQTLEPADSGEEGEESHDEEDSEEDDEEEQTDEGNAFTGKLKQTPQGEKFKMGDKTYTDKSSIEEDDMEEGNMFTGNLAKARAAGKKEADLDGDGDMEKVHEGHDETCNECGMYESECECDHESVEEGFSNDAGGDAMGDTELAKLKALLSMGGDLHSMKRDQTVLNPTQVSVKEAINDWVKLSGIK